ncbi:MAG: alpha/beta fold hydrolase [Anaerolineales bacterium]
MKRKLRGIKRRAVQLDFNLYRTEVPIKGLSDSSLSVIDIWPEHARNTVVFIHGYAGCAETWEYQINYFSREYRVVVPDLRGHGQSDAPFTQYTMPELVEDIETIADKLSLAERFILVGHSFGGAICIEYAYAHPERLDKLVLIATAGEYPMPRIVSLASRIPTAAFRPFWRYRPRWNAEVHVMKRMMLNNMRKWSGWDQLEHIHTPTLILTGERDRYFPHRVYAGVAEKIPDARVVDIGGSKHKVQLERHQAVNRALERFFEEGEQKKRLTWRDQTLKPDGFQRPWLSSYGKHTPHTFPIPRRPLHLFLEASAAMLPKNTATIFYGSTLTYQQLDRRVNQFAHALHGLGVRPGDRVAVVLPNMPQLIIAYYAILKIGGVVVLSNPEADATTILHQLQETESKVLVTLANFAGMASTIQAQYPIQVIFTSIRKT